MKKSISLLGASAVFAVIFSMAAPALVAAQGASPIMVGPVAISAADDIGTCNNTWAEDNYNKFYMLTANSESAYSLKIDYRDGTFVTVDGNVDSPGACESGTNDGNTVPGGITGQLHEEWNTNVSATVAPNRHPDCGLKDQNCSSATAFLNAVFGAGNWSYEGDWTEWGYYRAGINGVWYDTIVGWPTNDWGDITGSSLPAGNH